jgi:hypothetical protein
VSEEDPMARVDTSVPVSARIWNYWMGVATTTRSTRKPGTGVRQFLDIGSGLPSHDPTHGVAQGVAPESRVVYVDNDPLVLAHAPGLAGQ